MRTAQKNLLIALVGILSVHLMVPAWAQDGVPPTFEESSDSSSAEGEDLELDKTDDLEAEQDQAPEKPAPVVVKAPKPPAKSKQPEGNSQPDNTVFKPSEEISDDSPVPFPVDI